MYILLSSGPQQPDKVYGIPVVLWGWIKGFPPGFLWFCGGGSKDFHLDSSIKPVIVIIKPVIVIIKPVIVIIKSVIYVVIIKATCISFCYMYMCILYNNIDIHVFL